MEFAAGVITIAAALVSVYLHFLNSSPEARAEFIRSTKTVIGSAGRIVAYVIILLIAIMSVTAIYLFWSGEKPITRPEVVMLFLHFFNLSMYGFLSIAIPAKAIRKRLKSEPDEGDTSVEQPKADG